MANGNSPLNNFRLYSYIVTLPKKRATPPKMPKEQIPKQQHSKFCRRHNKVVPQRQLIKGSSELK